MNHTHVALALLELASALLSDQTPDPVPEPQENAPIAPSDLTWLWLVDPDELAVLQAIGRNTGPDGWCRTGITALSAESSIPREILRTALDALASPQPAADDLPARPAVLTTSRTSESVRILTISASTWARRERPANRGRPASLRTLPARRGTAGRAMKPQVRAPVFSGGRGGRPSTLFRSLSPFESRSSALRR